MTTIEETVRLLREQPDKGRSRPAVTARTDGSQAVLEAGPFTWRADLPAMLGGTNEAPSPTAMLLGALAGCAAVFIKDTLAPQLGVRVEAVEATASATSARDPSESARTHSSGLWAAPPRGPSPSQ